MGVPISGGAIGTAAGLVIVAGTADGKLRILDKRTGRQLWSASLPRGAFATPMTYLAPESGKQIIVVAAGGTLGLGGLDDAELIAFALP
jgi:glucose dehydrogenase